jgi:acetyl esterase/lipase
MPNFALLIYPAYLWDRKANLAAPEVQPHHGMPPIFMMQTKDDGLFDVGSYAENLIEAGVNVDCVVFDKGGHGYGLRLPSNLQAHAWSSLAAAWIAVQVVAANRAPTQITP